MKLSVFLIASTLCMIGMGYAKDIAQPLQPPFDVNTLLRSPDAESTNFICKSPPASVKDLTFDGFYKHGSGSSVVDKEAMRKYRTARKPIDKFARTIIKMSDRYLASAESNAAIAQCVFDWLYQWASGRAFLGEVSRQGGYVRKWALGTISLAYLKIRKAQSFDATKQKKIKKWIADWAEIVRDDYSTDIHKSSRNNNHAYWASWSVGLAGVALNNRSHFDWMVERQHIAMRQIEDDGTLPLEMKRRSKALHYHVYSTQVLVMIAALAARNGTNLFGIENGALHRLIKRTVSGLSNQSYFTEKTGKKQTWVGRVSGGKLAWMEAYNARFPTSEIKRWIEKYRPMKNRRIGGNATLLYGVR
ncbi:MAG: hypothetical protein GKS01_04385 [Alphaproteobacteria bacterium]|nr:hypothetical protein [Alphaproteobacteria bacterium]